MWVSDMHVWRPKVFFSHCCTIVIFNGKRWILKYRNISSLENNWKISVKPFFFLCVYVHLLYVYHWERQENLCSVLCQTLLPSFWNSREVHPMGLTSLIKIVLNTKHPLELFWNVKCMLCLWIKSFLKTFFFVSAGTITATWLIQRFITRIITG